MSYGTNGQLIEDYARIERAIVFIEQNFQDQPALKDVAENIGLSEYHFQRLFSRWAGISPKRFLQFLTVEHAKQLLTESRNLLDVTYKTGLSGPGRLHDLFVTCEAMTPGEFKTRAAGLVISYGFQPTPFGECLVATTARGICGLDFVAPGQRGAALAELKQKWAGATFREDQDLTGPLADQIFGLANHNPELPIVLKGTNFQIKVWHALLRIPTGAVVSYQAVANSIGRPGATRAVASAVARNPIGFVIPCHRVIRKVGKIGEYHWGGPRKRAILAWEAGRSLDQVPVT
jgi:AraC family transcriptional regulator of adaptative response/methylated-DNA-[protein]-cysteine methyltransferase